MEEDTLALDVQVFAAQRTEEQDKAIAALNASVTAWMNDFGDTRKRDAVVDVATRVWEEHFKSQTRNAGFGAARRRFRESMGESLAQTTEPSTPVADHVINRVATWAAVSAMNSGFMAGFSADGGTRVRWVTMHDDSVRGTHREADGQTAPIGGTFDIGGFELHYPGEPVGPPNIWINCRCVIGPAARRRGRMSTKVGELNVQWNPRTGKFDARTEGGSSVGEIAPDEVETPLPDDPNEELPDDIDEPMVDDVDDLIEIPVHGVATISGKPTGDGRMFARDGVTYRPLPLPMRYEFVGTHGGDTSNVAPVGRIDELWAVDAGDYIEHRYRGVIITTKAYANEALEGIADRSLTGVSVEMDDIIAQEPDPINIDEGMTDEDIAAAVRDSEMQPTVFSQSRICGFTIVPIPAFHEGFIALGEAFPDELSEDDKAALAACGCADEEVVEEIELTAEEEALFEKLLEGVTASATFAPGTKDGAVGTLAAWSSLTSGPRRSSTNDLTTTSAGTGLGISTAPDTVGWPWTGTVESARLIASSTSDESARFLTASSSTISAETVAVSTRDISNLSRISATSNEETRTTAALVASAGMGSTTSRIRMRGTSGLIMEFSGGPVVPVTSMDAENGIVKLSDGTVLVAQRPLGNFAPGTRDGPGWITHPRATARIRRYWVRGKGAAKIKWGVPGDFNRCRRQLGKYVQNPEWLAGLCANMHKEAIGVWPGQEDGGRGRHALVSSGVTPAPMFTLTAAAPKTEARAEFYQNPQLTAPTALQVDLETGRVFGHLATWGVCHIGIPGVCTTAPHSASNYAYFRTGAVHTDAGPVAVGHLTLATGHAPIKATAQAAAAHYDNTGSVVADVAAGEDSFGIWVAGELRDGVSADDARTLAASALSGDWRQINGALELVGALCVNVPGFPIPRNALAASAGEQTALVAAGIVQHETTQTSGSFDAVTIAAISRTAVQEYMAEQDRRKRLLGVRDTLRAERVASIKSKIKE